VNRKSKEALEQWGGHFTGLGIIVGALFGELAIVGFVIREFTDWKLPWPYKGQWPPGDPYYALDDLGEREIVALPADRVEDLRKDAIFTCSGIVVGLLIRDAIALWLLLR